MALTDQTGAERTLRVVHEEVLDETQLEAIAGGNQDPQTSSGRISVTSEVMRRIPILLR